MFLEMQLLIPFLLVFALIVVLILALRPKRPPPIPRYDVMRDQPRNIVPDYGANYPGRGDRPKPFPRSKLRQKRPADPVILTTRMLESANISRRINGQPTLTRDGFKAAVASSPIQHRNSDDWIAYLILYQCLLADHQSSRAGVSMGITVQPDEPGGGHGEFGGAGASGKWDDTSPGAASNSGVGSLAVAAGAFGVLAAQYSGRDPASEPSPAPAYDEDSKYQPGDIVGGYGGAAPERADPAPVYSSPDPSPSYDSGSSGGGGGGDSGGGGGGGD